MEKTEGCAEQCGMRRLLGVLGGRRLGFAWTSAKLRLDARTGGAALNAALKPPMLNAFSPCRGPGQPPGFIPPCQPVLANRVPTGDPPIWPGATLSDRAHACLRGRSNRQVRLRSAWSTRV